MTFPLLPIGGAALVQFASQALHQLEPGQFLRQLWNVPETRESSRETQGANPGPTIKVDIDRALPAVAERLQRRLLSAGVDLVQPIVLKADGNGGILVDGEHRDRSRIEEVLADDLGLRSDFLELAAAATQDHRQRVEWVGASFGEFRLHLSAAGATIAFE